MDLETTGLNNSGRLRITEITLVTVNTRYNIFAGTNPILSSETKKVG